MLNALDQKLAPVTRLQNLARYTTQTKECDETKTFCIFAVPFQVLPLPLETHSGRYYCSRNGAPALCSALQGTPPTRSGMSMHKKMIK